MSNTKWTKEPWDAKFEKMGGYDCMTDAFKIHSGNKLIADLDLAMQSHEDEIEANAEHIVSCVNALEGLNPEGIKEVVEAARETVNFLRVYQEGNTSLETLHDSILDLQSALEKVRP
jgi:hypothetical protein